MGMHHAIWPSYSWVFIQEKQKHSLTKTCMKAHGSFLIIAPSYYAWAAITKYRKLGVYKQTFISHTLEAGSLSEIKALADSVSSEKGPLPGS